MPSALSRGLQLEVRYILFSKILPERSSGRATELNQEQSGLRIFALVSNLAFLIA
jgi:hypothetical protein